VIDVDDMQDIAKLPDYVSQSAVLLVFLSRGYFKSVGSFRFERSRETPSSFSSSLCSRVCFCASQKACITEIEQAVSLQMPLVLCHHSGIQTGGAPMNTLHGECPPDCVMFVFGDDTHRRPYIPWVRQPDFQLETLKQITTATIQGCEERLLAGLNCATDNRSLKDRGSVDRSMKDRGAQERSQKIDRSSPIVAQIQVQAR
jgi:hypothetical protein